MCKISGILLVIAIVFYLFGCRMISYILGGAGAALLLVLLILVKIELYQDNQDYLEWKNDNKKK
ncbi:MAG TPA: hypothetical protein VHO94_03680 [Oscillospiraceae bacterium]|nr:hypothetical protein [Oscillospiraceae bacterium]